MKLGALVENTDLGLGVVIAVQLANKVLVRWYQWDIPSTMVVTKIHRPGQPEKWFAPSGFGTVHMLSE